MDNYIKILGFTLMISAGVLLLVTIGLISDAENDEQRIEKELEIYRTIGVVA